MNNTNTGGPAFPVLIVDRPKELEHFNGMTLRDYFAAKAMQAMASRFEASSRMLASSAYEVADAMLKARDA